MTDAASLRALAERTRVLATTVGPYGRHGEPVVAACADTGTDYADLTGESEFVDRMWLAHHERAEATGRADRARLRVRLGAARPRGVVHRAAAAGGTCR